MCRRILLWRRSCWRVGGTRENVSLLVLSTRILFPTVNLSSFLFPLSLPALLPLPYILLLSLPVSLPLLLSSSLISNPSTLYGMHVFTILLSLYYGMCLKQIYRLYLLHCMLLFTHSSVFIIVQVIYTIEKSIIETRLIFLHYDF